jgi:hypothetical protein
MGWIPGAEALKWKRRLPGLAPGITAGMVTAIVRRFSLGVFSHEGKKSLLEDFRENRGNGRAKCGEKMGTFWRNRRGASCFATQELAGFPAAMPLKLFQ